MLAVVRCNPKHDPGCDGAAVALVPCPVGMRDCYTVVPCDRLGDCRTLAPCDRAGDCYALAAAGPLTPVADPRFTPVAADLPPGRPLQPEDRPRLPRRPRPPHRGEALRPGDGPGLQRRPHR